VSEVASEFPEYRFLVKPKFINKTSLEASPFPGVGLLADNIETTTLLASDLIASARYVLSDASSVITEAIHLGVPALMLDMIPNHPQCLYRDFPNLCVTSGIDAASQLKRWETGTEEFDRSIYSDLINLSNQWTFDIVSMDMGLHSKIAQ